MGKLPDYRHRRPWRQGEIKTLRDLYLLEHKSFDEISEAMDRTPQACREKAKAIGLLDHKQPDHYKRRIEATAYEVWRLEKHNGRMPKTTVDWPEYSPDLPDRAFDEDEPIGGKK